MTKIYAQRLESIFEKCDKDGTFETLVSADRLRLSREKMRKLCDFPRSTIYQNSEVVRIIGVKEMELLSRGILCAKRDTLSLVDEDTLEDQMLSRLDSLQNELFELRSVLLGIGGEMEGMLHED